MPQPLTGDVIRGPALAAAFGEAIASWANEGGAMAPIVASAPLSVLIVEDDAVLANLYGEVLQGMGYKVCAIVDDEAAAVAAAFRCKPDLMLVDQRLGVGHGSGVGAVAGILVSLSVPHIFVSGDPAPVLLLRPDAVVLRKPFHEAELAVAIRRVLAERDGSAPPAPTRLPH